MLVALKEPSSGLKKYMEENLPVTALSLCQNLLFREIWHPEQPLDPTQGVTITLNAAKKN